MDDFRTQTLRRANIETLELPVHAPVLASADYLDVLATRALETTPPLIELAEEATRLSIDKDRRRTSNWNRIAYLDVLKNGRITHVGINALRESFYRSPYGDTQDMRWRLQFANAYWHQLPRDLKTQSLAQITVLQQHWQDQRWLGHFSRTAVAEISDRIAQSRQGATQG